MSNQPNNKQVSIMAIACVSVIAITMMVLTAMMNVANAQTPYTDAYLAKKRATYGNTLADDLNIDFDKWRQYSEQELNLRQDTRNLLYVGGLLACGAIMNNNGSDDFAVSLAGAITLTAGVDNVLSIIRRNKKLNPQIFK